MHSHYYHTSSSLTYSYAHLSTTLPPHPQLRMWQSAFWRAHGRLLNLLLRRGQVVLVASVYAGYLAALVKADKKLADEDGVVAAAKSEKSDKKEKKEGKKDEKGREREQAKETKKDK
jgi:hypothetical protein